MGHRAQAHDLQLRASDGELVCALPAECAALAAGPAVYKKLLQAPFENQKFPFRMHRTLLGLVAAARKCTPTLVPLNLTCTTLIFAANAKLHIAASLFLCIALAVLELRKLVLWN